MIGLGARCWERVSEEPKNAPPGNRSGRRTVVIKRTKKDELSEADLGHMNNVSNYIARHTAQRPDGDIENTDWRYSLMNWGHDPMKSGG